MDHLIIDGFNLAYRSHYGHFTSQTSLGILSGCVYGFLVSLRSVKNKFPWCHVTVAWDTDSTRKRIVYAEYKAERTRPSGISEQIQDLKTMFTLLNVSQVEYAGEEADDVIGSLVTRYLDGTNKIYIYTSDKDMLQLVKDGKVVVISPKTGKCYDEEAVKAEWGVSPGNLPKFLCLRGDKVDNVPGVPYLKSSVIAHLSEKYKDLQEIYTHLPEEQLTDFQRQSLIAFQGQSVVNQELINLRGDLELNIQTGTANPEAFALCLNKYEIKSIKPDIYPNVFSESSSFNRRQAPVVQSYSLFEE